MEGFQPVSNHLFRVHYVRYTNLTFCGYDFCPLMSDGSNDGLSGVIFIILKSTVKNVNFSNIIQLVSQRNGISDFI